MQRAAGTVILTRDSILMVRRRDGRIGIPGGKCNECTDGRWEEFEDAAIRETYEETGYVVNLLDEGLVTYNLDNERTRFHSFEATIVAGSLRASPEGQPFWLRRSILRNLPGILAFPEWTKIAIHHYGI